jgi:transposase
MRMRITIVLVKLVFSSCRSFKREHRAAIHFCVKLKEKAIEMFGMLKSAYGEECLSRTTLFEWHKRFKEGREALQSNERKDRPSGSRTEEKTEVIQRCLAEDGTLSVRC